MVLAVAENKRSHEHFLEQMREASSSGGSGAAGSGPPPECMGYDDMRGIGRLRTALAALLRRTFLPVATEERLTISAGCGAIIENVAFLTVRPRPRDSVHPTS